ncbi:lathosterol oxidase-like [Lingula anatina]|uniref:Lathosterol oxidase-like n=1 Tax=Lingula anatina TaxID=7574 RepID=A0A1S3IIK0_LINAN|nr:lathosterol oxidase-like [Lingula anatina]|eukprot:XP_013397329.1 lathosterol oxidase-like [Lingula anatina]
MSNVLSTREQAAWSLSGDWLLVVVNLWKQFQPEYGRNTPFGSQENNATDLTWLERHRLQNVQYFILLSLLISFSVFYSMGGYFQYFYYIKRREQSEEWKCQPNKFLTKENERHEFIAGSVNMACGATVSGILACFILNGGYSTLYYSASERGWLYFVLSGPIYYLYIDGVSYYLHRTFHNPYLYKKIHKHHHRYHQPTAFSAVAMHPVEFFMYQAVMALPIFTVPIHAGVFLTVLMYFYYYGMIDHSGVKMDAIWPWQPPSTFHDNHHQYFHCNFGFNSLLFDWMFDTLRKEGRVYGEDIFGGRGRSIENDKEK